MEEGHIPSSYKSPVVTASDMTTRPGKEVIAIVMLRD